RTSRRRRRPSSVAAGTRWARRRARCPRPRRAPGSRAGRRAWRARPTGARPGWCGRRPSRPGLRHEGHRPGRYPGEEGPAAPGVTGRPPPQGKRGTCGATAPGGAGAAVVVGVPVVVVVQPPLAGSAVMVTTPLPAVPWTPNTTLLGPKPEPPPPPAPPLEL